MSSKAKHKRKRSKRKRTKRLFTDFRPYFSILYMGFIRQVTIEESLNIAMNYGAEDITQEPELLDIEFLEGTE